jgi:serine/threonine protein kinase
MPATHLIGQKVGEYEVVRRIGLGGMGAVYEGRHPLIGKRVAIKVLLPQFSEDEAQMKRFLAEARSVNEIRHRGIVDIFAFGETVGGAHYFVMEFLEGTSFEGLLKSRHSLAPGEALALMEEVLDAVAAAHQAGIIHRDLKPSNLFLVDVGRGRPFVKLLDFGLAKLTRDEGGAVGAEATGIVGTPRYMAPEQVNGLRAGPEADVYALGVVLFELISGRPPFVADSPLELMTRQLEARPPRLSELVPGTPLEVERLVERMLAKRPQDRPRDAESLRAEVARLKSRLDAPARRGMTPQQRAALDEDVGPTMVRVVRRGGPATTTPDITPLKSRTVGRVDPERTMIGAGPGGLGEDSLPWGNAGPANTLDTGDSDPELSHRTVIESALVARPRGPVEPPVPTAPSVPIERPVPTMPFAPEERPVPTVPVSADERVITLKPTPTREGPAATFESAPPRPTSQSSPTLSATNFKEDTDEAPAPGASAPGLGSRHSRAMADARSARVEEDQQRRLGKLVLYLGLGAAGLVGLGVLLALLR